MTAAGRVLRASYAVAGAAAELDRTLPLAPDEQVLLQGAVRVRDGGLLALPAVLRLTSARLAVLAHRAIGADRVWDLPRGSVQDVRSDGARLLITWQDAQGETSELRLGPWTGQRATARPLRDLAPVGAELHQWLGPSAP